MNHPFIGYLQLFRPIPDKDRQLILDQLEEHAYKEGEYLFRAGHISKELFFIRNGILRIVMFNDEGKELTYFL